MLRNKQPRSNKRRVHRISSFCVVFDGGCQTFLEAGNPLGGFEEGVLANLLVRLARALSFRRRRNPLGVPTCPEGDSSSQTRRNDRTSKYRELRSASALLRSPYAAALGREGVPELRQDAPAAHRLQSQGHRSPTRIECRSRCGNRVT